MALNSKISAEEFAKQLKTKYPQYKDVDDSKLVSQMIEKYPQYKDKVVLKKKNFFRKYYERFSRSISAFSSEWRRGL
jgi:predicted YcjX-like family ATPase